MPGPYGSVANPVQLDPFRRIVEVHWNTDKYIALQWSPCARTTWINDTASCSPPEYGGPFSGYPAPPHPVSFTYLSSVEFYSPGSQGINNIRVQRPTGWEPPAGDVIISGLPPMGAPINHAEWEYVWQLVVGSDNDVDTDLIHGHSENDFAASFSPASGTDTDIPAPSGGGFFQTGFTPNFGYLANPYVSSDPFCYTDGSVNGVVRMYNETAERIDTFPAPLNDIIATYRGKTYRGIAAKQIESVIGSLTLARSVWILCERETAP